MCVVCKCLNARGAAGETHGGGSEAAPPPPRDKKGYELIKYGGHQGGNMFSLLCFTSVSVFFIGSNCATWGICVETT